MSELLSPNKRKAHYYVMKVRQLLEDNTIKLSRELADQNSFRAMSTRLSEYGDQTTDDQAWVLLALVYSELGKCEYNPVQFAAFSEWGSAVFGLLFPDRGAAGEWFSDPKRMVKESLLDHAKALDTLSRGDLSRWVEIALISFLLWILAGGFRCI